MSNWPPNFSLVEFAKFGGDLQVMTPKQIEACRVTAWELQALRDAVGEPVYITPHGGFRLPENNASINGAPKSQHLLGTAADIVVKGKSPSEVADMVEGLIEGGLMTQGGLGRYPGFTHYDRRGTRARW